jgi:hypothetical protein
MIRSIDECRSNSCFRIACLPYCIDVANDFHNDLQNDLNNGNILRFRVALGLNSTAAFAGRLEKPMLIPGVNLTRQKNMVLVIF